jgi:hypothetical protein
VKSIFTEEEFIKKKMHNIEAHNLFSSPNIITISESRRLDGEGASMGEAVKT